MADEDVVEKTPLDKSRDIITQLKEMQHYAKTNIERLTAIWLQLDDELKIKDVAQQVEVLLTQQNTLHDALESTIGALDAECERMPKAP